MEQIQDYSHDRLIPHGDVNNSRLTTPRERSPFRQ